MVPSILLLCSASRYGTGTSWSLLSLTWDGTSLDVTDISGSSLSFTFDASSWDGTANSGLHLELIDVTSPCCGLSLLSLQLWVLFSAVFIENPSYPCLLPDACCASLPYHFLGCSSPYMHGLLFHNSRILHLG